MNAPHPRCQAAMPVQHAPDIVRSLCLTLQPGAGIHQVSGIQQDPFPCKTDSLQQSGRLLRLCKGKAWPPLVCHKEFKGSCVLAQNEVYHLHRRINDLLIGVQPVVGIPFLN